MALTNRSLLAVTDALRRSGELDKVGGAYRITEIALLPHDAENLDYALGEVLTVSRQRQASKIGAQLHRGDITVKQAQEYLAKLNQRREPEKSWMDALSAAVVTPSLQSCSPMKAPPEA